MQATIDADEQLMVRVRAGDRGPLSILLARWAPSLWTFLMRMFGDRRRTEEVFREVFLAVWVYRRRYPYPRPFGIWLLGIATKKCLHRLRRGRRRSGVAEPADHHLPAGDVVSAPPQQAVDPAVVVCEAVLRLHSWERAVLVLRTGNKLSYAEIAQITGEPEVLVRSQMADALARVRRHWQRRRPTPSAAEGNRRC